eukprot:ctg_1007.g418
MVCGPCCAQVRRRGTGGHPPTLAYARAVHRSLCLPRAAGIRGRIRRVAPGVSAGARGRVCRGQLGGAAAVAQRQHQAALLLAATGGRRGGLCAGAPVSTQRHLRQGAGVAADIFDGVRRRAQRAPRIRPYQFSRLRPPGGGRGRLDPHGDPPGLGVSIRRRRVHRITHRRGSHDVHLPPQLGVVARLSRLRRAPGVRALPPPRRGAQRHRDGDRAAGPPHQPHYRRAGRGADAAGEVV